MTAARRLTTSALLAAMLLPGGADADAGADSKILGEWVLSFTTRDANSNRVLDESERKPADSAVARESATGYLRFEKTGKVEIDRKLRYKGRYEVLAQEPRDELVLVFDKDIGTFRMLVIRATDKELVLEPNIGMFDVYRRP